MTQFNHTPEHVHNVIFEKYLEEHFDDGQIGLAEFTYKHFLIDSDGNPTYTCADGSRYKFIFVDGENNVQTDFQATFLLELILPDAIKKSSIICDEKRNRLGLTHNQTEFHNSNMGILKDFKTIRDMRANSGTFRRIIAAKTMNAHEKPLNKKMITMAQFPKELERIYLLSEEEWNAERPDPEWDYESMQKDFNDWIAEQHDESKNYYNYSVYVGEFYKNKRNKKIINHCS